MSMTDEQLIEQAKKEIKDFNFWGNVHALKPSTYSELVSRLEKRVKQEQELAAVVRQIHEDAEATTKITAADLSFRFDC